MSSLILPLVGGVLIGLASAGLLVLHGRIAGITGIAAGVLAPVRGDWAWRASFVAGLLAVGVLASLWVPEAFGGQAPLQGPSLIAAGLIVGVGTRVGNGCTSGHGVCGVGRLSPRSTVATMVFIASGMATVSGLRLLGFMS
jgi:uncharacterized membrane protein YedE/YeeE